MSEKYVSRRAILRVGVVEGRWLGECVPWAVRCVGEEDVVSLQDGDIAPVFGVFFFLMMGRPPSSPLFPYAPLFRCGLPGARSPPANRPGNACGSNFPLRRKRRAAPSPLPGS